jgi:hypothetical protein
MFQWTGQRRLDFFFRQRRDKESINKKQRVDWSLQSYFPCRVEIQKQNNRKITDSLTSSHVRSQLLKEFLKNRGSQTPVAYICHPSYLGGWDWEDCGLRPAQFLRPHLNRKELGMAVHAGHPHGWWEVKIGESWSSPIWAKTKSYLWNNQSEKGWRHGSCGRAPASPVWSP